MSALSLGLFAGYFHFQRFVDGIGLTIYVFMVNGNDDGCVCSMFGVNELQRVTIAYYIKTAECCFLQKAEAGLVGRPGRQNGAW
ncbi:hypothetical protein F6Y04_00665 [Bacillus megaterium]|nr:hypothetical protein [Priestia megaterium]